MSDDFQIQVERLQVKLSRLADEAPGIAFSAVGAGLGTLAAAVKAASPGTVKQEVGFYVRRDGNGAWGRAGLMQFPDRGEKGAQPHGVFLDQGTKYIEARHFIGMALASAMSTAQRRMIGVAKGKQRSLARA